MLREPLEAGVVHISRAARQGEFPARFQLVAAMNPCPCGWLGHASGRCGCTPERVARYRRRISGALYDRLDIAIEVLSVTAAELAQRTPSEADDSTLAVRARVAAARERQLHRQGRTNARLDVPELESHARRTPDAERLLAGAMSKLSLSARGYHRAVRVARTIADLAGSDTIDAAHAAEAIGYRRILAGA